jgi:DNA-binding winged helix-turn-helix (wHTH) protein/tetratricopeptide (TPR) repeat protein
METNGSGELLRFGPFEIDPEREELKRSGLVLRLPRQPFRILLLLASRAGEVVSRDEIHSAIWGSETYVDFEHGINSAIRQIRFVLGDHAESPRYVRTLPRRGYSFIAQVERMARPGEFASAPVVEITPVVETPVPVSRPSSVRMIAAAAVIAIVVMIALLAQARRATEVPHAGGRTIAIKPFRRLGPPIKGIDERSFGAELRAVLNRLPPERVSLVEFDEHVPAQADVVIDGSVHASEEGIRVIVSLADAASRTQIWSETYQRPLNRCDGVAMEVAHRVMWEVARRFLPPPRHAPLLLTSTAPSTLTLYQRARLLHSRNQPYDWIRTRELYEAALKEDPRFAEAWSGLSDVWATQTLTMGGSKEERAHAAAQTIDSARRALALQPRNAEAHGALGVIAAQYHYDLAAAEDALRRAATADPGYVDGRANLAIILSMRGEAEESLREFAFAQQLDPIMFDLNTTLPVLYFQARRYEEARARYRDILAIDPQSRPALWGLLTTYVAQKNWTDAIAVAARIGSLPADGVPNTEEGFVTIYRRLEPFMLEGRRHGGLSDYSLAHYYGQLGDRDRAFALLDQAIDTRVPVVSYIMTDPRLDALRSDPRFDAVLARLKLGQPPDRRLPAD